MSGVWSCNGHLGIHGPPKAEVARAETVKGTVELGKWAREVGLRDLLAARADIVEQCLGLGRELVSWGWGKARRRSRCAVCGRGREWCF